MQVINGQMSIFDRDMPCGKTSPEHIAATKARTSVRCSKSSVKSKIPMPLFLDLRRRGVSGLIPGSSWVTGIPSRGEYSTQDFGEFPSVAEESGLSQILEETVPQKYYLSARACEGVLRRAERRGKQLPDILKTALEQQIERWEKYGTPIYGLSSSLDGVIVFSHYKGSGARSGKEREFCVFSIDRAAFNQGKNARYDIGIDDSGYSQALVAKGPNAVCYAAELTIAEVCYIVRRLTPLECCRLQGMPDWWTDGVEGSDAAKYKMWGNGMALPNALYVLEGIAEIYSQREGKFV